MLQNDFLDLRYEIQINSVPKLLISVKWLKTNVAEGALPHVCQAEMENKMTVAVNKRKSLENPILAGINL